MSDNEALLVAIARTLEYMMRASPLLLRGEGVQIAATLKNTADAVAEPYTSSRGDR